MIKAVVFDVGETLIDDTREWKAWADWLSVPLHTVSALVGAVVVTGRDNADALRLVRPGIDIEAERQSRENAGHGEVLTEADLYPDVRPALAALQEHGLWVGIAGNQTRRAAELLRALSLPADAIATSGEWGVAKPHAEFWTKLIKWTALPAPEILYVGDHPANDVLPAQAAGIRTAHLRRGPWGHFWADAPSATAADWQITELTELTSLIMST
ncbi:HAD family hydrolase [Actinocorallia sp. A-T 12471]|uniref:HAD family hydrolase n=1 Tax=Actinocorallia sp. A-T 12471 TaxID=3089813 RepID=UPI0029D277D1|nr:HAD family hydrolase [Actinocorallia sp. A-T 12471]MDX6743609.1 HAD family hydrolase [Actinocorallia sp. A-T 12471]